MNSSFNTIREIQKSQNFKAFDDSTAQELDFTNFTILPNQFIYKVDCKEAEITETKGNTKHLFNIPELTKIDQVYEMIRPDQVNRFIKETADNFDFVSKDPNRAIPNRNLFSTIFSLRVKNTYQTFLRQTFSLRSDKNGVVTHTGGIYTALPNISKNDWHESKVFGEDAVFYKNEHLSHFKNLLSLREIQILKLISEGYKTKAIGEMLFISDYTVDTHRKNMIQKLEAINTPHLVALAKDMRLI